MTEVLADTRIIERLLDFYTPEIEANLVNGATGMPVHAPESIEARAALLTLALFDPEVIYFWGDKIAFSQLDVYRPYLARSKRRAAILCSGLQDKPQSFLNLPNVPAITRAAGYEPFLALPLCPSARSVVYVTNKTRNIDLIRNNPSLVHVLGLHGDSDKTSSASRVSAIYDLLLVADRFAVDRYARARVDIPLDRFLPIGGSPIEGAEATDSFAPPKRILYAPTWEGYENTGNYCSVREVAPVLAEAGKAAEVIFRRHPGTGQRLQSCKDAADALSAALATPAEAPETKGAQFNWADLLITDISGVLSEFLFTRKPIALPVRPDDEWLNAVIRGALLAEFVYLWDYSSESVAKLLKRVAKDPLRKARLARSEAMFFGCRSADELAALYERALDFAERHYAYKQMRAGPAAGLAGAGQRLFQAVPDDPELAGVVAEIRAGRLMLGPEAEAK